VVPSVGLGCLREGVKSKTKLSRKLVFKEFSLRNKLFRPDRFQKPVRSGATTKILFGLECVTKQLCFIELTCFLPTKDWLQ